MPLGSIAIQKTMVEEEGENRVLGAVGQLAEEKMKGGKRARGYAQVKQTKNLGQQHCGE